MATRLRTAFVAFGALAALAGALLMALAPTEVFGAVGVEAAVAPTPVSGAGERPVAVRFANLTDDGGVLDILLDGRARVVAMVGGRTTDYIVVPSGRRAVGVRRDGIDVSMADAELVLAPGTSPTVLLLGRSSNPSMFILPQVADSGPSIRVLNASRYAVQVDIGGAVTGVEPSGSYLTPVKAGVVEVESALGEFGDGASARLDVSVGPTQSIMAIVTGTPDRVSVHAIAPQRLAPELLALEADDGDRTGAVPSVLGEDGIWMRRVLAGLVVILVFAATLSSLAVFRVDSLDDRVRNRMR